MTVTIHIASGSDLGAVNARYADIGFLPSSTGELIILASLDGATAGQGRVVPVDASGGELGGIYVLPQYQGLGVAKRIVDFLIQSTDLPILYCLPFAELEGFYRSMGFSPVEQPEGVPRQVTLKHQWCNATYDKPVSLLIRVAP